MTMEKEEGVLDLEEEGVLHWSLVLPEFSGTKKGEKRLQRYYQKVGVVWKKHWFSALYPLVSEAFQEEKHPLPWSVSLEGEVIDLSALFQGEICSISLTYVEKRGKARRNVRFFSDLWDCAQGVPLSPRHFPPLKGRKIGEFRQKVSEICEKREDFLLLSQYEEGLERYICFENTHFTQEGVEFFVPQGTVAGRVEGVPKFLIPYSS